MIVFVSVTLGRPVDTALALFEADVLKLLEVMNGF